MTRMQNPTNRRLAQATGYSTRTIQRAIKSLVETGFLVRSIRGRRRRLAYAKLFTKTGDHAGSLARAEAVAILDFAMEQSA